MIQLSESDDNTYFDKNGSIKNLFFAPINHVAVIESKAGSQRSNHRHKQGWHYLYVVSGRMLYEERNMDGTNKTSRILEPGEWIFTGPNKVHRTTFPVDSVILSFTNNKSQKEHAADLVREEF